jgi:DnaJ-class molecular chaperone
VAKTATLEEIKKAYRILAKKYHPDLNPGNKKAEEKFKEISHANDLIGTPEARKKFDSGELDEQQHQQHQTRSQRSGPAGPRNTRYTDSFANQFANENLFEELFGSQRSHQAPKAQRDTHFKMSINFEESILGSEKVITLPNGKNLKVKIPSGINSGTKLRFKGQGDQTSDEQNPGDALIEIEVTPLEGWTRSGIDLEMELPISFIEGILGADISIKTMYGPVMLKILPGVSTGSKLRIKGKGVRIGSEVGNQIVKLKVVLPKIITPEQHEAITNIKSLFSYNPRGET